MLQNCKSSVIPLFGQNTDHSSVPARICTAVARSGGSGRPPGRRASASPLTVASTMAALRSLGTMLCIVVILAASTLSSGAAHAEQEVAGYTSAERVIRPSVRGVRYRSVQTLRCAGTVDTRGDACRKRCKSAGTVSQRRHGPDADHAKDLDRIARSLRSRSQSLRPPRQHFGWCCIHPRTLRSLRRTRVPRRLQCRTWTLRTSSGEQLDRCRMRRKRTSRRSHR